VILIDEGESAIGLDAIGKIGIATCDKDEVTLECAVLVDWAGTVDAGVEAVIGAELGKEGTLGEDFRGRSGHEQFVSIEGVDDIAGVERVELDAEIGVSKFGAADNFLDALGKRSIRLRTDLGDEQGREKQ